MNNHESRIDNAVRYWAGVIAMRWYLGYKGGDVTIFENGESYFDAPDWQARIFDQDLILIFLAGVFTANPRMIANPELISCNNQAHPDMRWVRDILTYDYRKDHFPPQDMGVISQDDAIRFYWDQVIQIMLDPLIEWCCECIREALSENPSLSGRAIDLLLNELEVREQTRG